MLAPRAAAVTPGRTPLNGSFHPPFRTSNSDREISLVMGLHWGVV